MAAFASSLGNCRFAALYRSQDTAAFQEAHVEFFCFCGGVYHTIVYDNMKVAVAKFVGPTEKEPTEALIQLSSYYGFNYRFCKFWFYLPFLFSCSDKYMIQKILLSNYYFPCL